MAVGDDFAARLGAHLAFAVDADAQEARVEIAQRPIDEREQDEGDGARRAFIRRDGGTTYDRAIISPGFSRPKR